MERHDELTDEAFENQFASCALDPRVFTHEAHLRLAWIHITKYGRDAAMKNICRQLKIFATFAGAAGTYNQTVTIAAIKTVYHFSRRSDAGNFKDFINDFPRLKNNFKELMRCHYRTDIFNDETAGSEFLEPDLLPFG